ncbi:hypothetical protein LCGC14_1226000 [marine sediment metagenome]|uniref:Uncharacterized protein n=1 Tax=marine sediment metagenome TaxID=412755 RepID=A0A0F9NS63_9ZZZZ
MPEINWIEGQPSDDSLVVKAPRFLRSTWRVTAQGLAESLEWPGSGGGSNASQGELKLGTSKAFFAATSASSSAASESHRGKLFMSSDESRLLVYDSAYTAVAGTPFLIEHETYFAGATWVEHFGSYATDTGGTNVAGTVTLTGVSYAGEPVVILMSDNTTHRFQLTNVTGTNFRSNVSGPAGSNTYHWVSLGTVNT